MLISRSISLASILLGFTAIAIQAFYQSKIQEGALYLGTQITIIKRNASLAKLSR